MATIVNWAYDNDSKFFVAAYFRADLLVHRLDSGNLLVIPKLFR